MEVKEIGQSKTKKEITELLTNNDLVCILITYYGCEGLFVPVNDSETAIFLPASP